MATHKVSLSPNLNQRVLQYAVAHERMTPQDAIRELISMGLSVSPTDDATMVSKQRAYNDMRSWGFKQFAEKLEEIAVAARAHVGEFKRSGER